MDTRQVRTRHARAADAALPEQRRTHRSDTSVAPLVERWVAIGIITPEQGALLQADLRAAPPARLAARGSSVAVEALGYLGGAIVVIAVTAIVAQGWDDLGTGLRLLVVGLASALPLVAGSVVPRNLADVGVRLRSALWLVSTVAFASFLLVLTDQALDLGPHAVAITTSAVTAAYAGVLWANHRTILQQAATMVAVAVTAATSIDALEVSGDLPGTGVVATGVVWALLAWRGLVGTPRLALAGGAAMAVVGTMLTAGSDAGMGLMLLTVSVVVVVAVVRRDLLLLAVGTLGVLESIPAALSRWFPDSRVAPYVLLVAGVALVLTAVGIARRPADGRGGPR